MNYLFYLEPYAFLLRSNDKTVVYNTLNATYLICGKSSVSCPLKPSDSAPLC